MNGEQALLAVLIFVLGYLGNAIRLLGKKIDNMVCDPLCKERSEKCQKAFCTKIHALEREDEALTRADDGIREQMHRDNQEIWSRVNTHRHDDQGRVVVG